MTHYHNKTFLLQSLVTKIAKGIAYKAVETVPAVRADRAAVVAVPLAQVVGVTVQTDEASKLRA